MFCFRCLGLLPFNVCKKKLQENVFNGHMKNIKISKCCWKEEEVLLEIIYAKKMCRVILKSLHD